MSSHPQPKSGVTMVPLIKRNAAASWEEMIAHWFANHMPNVIAHNAAAKADGTPSVSRYVATLLVEQINGAVGASGRPGPCRNMWWWTGHCWWSL